MGFWIFMVVMLILIPLIMIGFGAYFKNNAPKEINDLFGYRTTMSKKNKETWEFAHRYCGKIWFAVGWVILPLSIIPMFLCLGENEDTIGIYGLIITIIQLIILIMSIFPVEKALKTNFDMTGKRKDGLSKQGD